MKRLLFILAWADCRLASLILAAGDARGAAARVLAAIGKLEEGARLSRRLRRIIWRPVVKRRLRR